MQISFKKIIFLFAIIVGGVFIYYQYKPGNECESRVNYDHLYLNRNINLDSLFLPVDSLEKGEVLEEWRSFNSESDQYDILEEFALYGRTCKLISHTYGGDRHFGAVLFPSGYDYSKSYPLIVWADGLNQLDPSTKLERSMTGFLSQHLDDYFIVVPSYRGQSLYANKKFYCSDGFFGDAFDGATSDALRLLHLTQTKLGNVDSTRLAIYGVSRGGTVALLAGIRNTNFNCIISQSGPTDFLRMHGYKRYGRQYRYIFLAYDLPFYEIRKKIIRCSPLHFIENYQGNLLLLHGRNDDTVPLFHASELIDKMKDRSSFEYVLTSDGHSMNQVRRVVSWLTENNK
ncbi:MAG: prolyl oligopeptidase family serine peptidase [Cyclobacteriaceae bacterium]